MEGEEIFNAIRKGYQQRTEIGGAAVQDNAIIGKSDALKRVCFAIGRMDPTDTTGLLR